MVILLVQIKGVVKSAPWGNIHLTADYGLYPLFFASTIKVYYTVHNTMVGNGNGIHILFFAYRSKPVNATGSV